MKRAILLLDAECGPCSGFGKQIEAEGLTEGTILELGSLHDLRYQDHVTKMEPTLVRYDGPAVAVSTGVRLATALVRIVGMRRAFRIAQLVREATSDAKFDPSRRSFLLRAAGAAAVLPVAGVLGTKAASAQTAPSTSYALTVAEALGAYRLLLASDEFKAAHATAKSDGLRHRRDTNLQTRRGLDGFASSTAAIGLVREHNGERLLELILFYEDAKGNRAEMRFMSALIDTRGNTIVALDVDGSGDEQEQDTPGGRFPTIPGESQRTQALP